MNIRLLAGLSVCCSVLLCGAYAAPQNDTYELENFSADIKERAKALIAEAAENGEPLIEGPSKETIEKVIEANKDLGLETQRQGFALSHNGREILNKDSPNLATMINNGFAMQQQAGIKQQNDQLNHFDILIFISFGLDQNTLRELMILNENNPRVAMVIRGLIKGTTNIQQTIYIIQKLSADLKLKNPPTVLINPVWFTQYQITKVPTIVALQGAAPTQSGNPETGEEIPATQEYARVSGLIDPLWLTDQITRGRRGDLGVQGPVAAIEERDMIEEMKERAMKVDWEGKKREAMKRVWQNVEIEPLELAERSRKRLLDPTFTVSRDLTAPDPNNPGNTLVIAKKGTKINPLDLRPFEQVMVLFDPTVKGELNFIKEKTAAWLKDHHKESWQIVYVMTGFDRDGGWESYNRMTDTLDKHVFVLNPEMKKSFGLEKHPCIVSQEGRYFAVEEFEFHGTQN